MILAIREMIEKNDSTILLSHPVIKKFSDVFLEDLLNKLLLMCAIQHAIDLVPGSSMSNFTHIQNNPTAHVVLKWQVSEFVDKRFIRESMSPCALPVLLTPKKDEFWRMCVNSCAINKITIKYRFSVQRFDDILDMMSNATIFSKIDMKSDYHQIRIHLWDKTKDGLYKWKVMPYELANAPPLCERWVKYYDLLWKNFL